MKAPKSPNIGAVQRSLRRGLGQSRNIIFGSRRMRGVPDAAIERELRKWGREPAEIWVHEAPDSARTVRKRLLRALHFFARHLRPWRTAPGAASARRGGVADSLLLWRCRRCAGSRAWDGDRAVRKRRQHGFAFGVGAGKLWTSPSAPPSWRTDSRRCARRARAAPEPRVAGGGPAESRRPRIPRAAPSRMSPGAAPRGLFSTLSRLLRGATTYVSIVHNVFRQPC